MNEALFNEAVTFIKGYREDERTFIPGYDDITDNTGLYANLDPSLVGPRLLANIFFTRRNTILSIDGINGGGKSYRLAAILRYLQAKLALISPGVDPKPYITTIPSRTVYAATREIGMPESSMPGAFSPNDYDAIHRKAELIILKLVYFYRISAMEFNGSGERGEHLNLNIFAHQGRFSEACTDTGNSYDWIYERVIGANPIRKSLSHRPEAASPEAGKPYFGGGGKRGTKLGILTRYKDIWSLKQEGRISFDGPPPPYNIIQMTDEEIYPFLDPLMKSLGYDEPKDLFERKLAGRLGHEDVNEVITQRISIIDLDRALPPKLADDETVIEELDRVRDMVDTMRNPAGHEPFIHTHATIDPSLLSQDFLKKGWKV